MYLVKRNPRYNYSHPSVVDSFFNDFHKNAPTNWQEDSTVWSPHVDVKESTDAYEVMADLPGLEKKDIKISLKENVLTLQGERTEEEKKEEENSCFSERAYGSFSRAFRLPEQVDEKNIHAEYANGVLKVTLQKSEDVKPREIEIN
jgi:HSP20 family protein